MIPVVMQGHKKITWAK